MDKSTKVAVEKYPIEMYGDVGWRCVDKNEHKRKYFVEGYHQAEKDLALTWEDIRSIIIINEKYTATLLNSTPWDGIYTKTEYDEVLRRFNEQRKK